MNRERKASLQVRSPWRGLCVSTLSMALMTLQGTAGASAMEGVLRGSFDHPDVMVLDRPVLAGMRLRTGLGALASQADPGIVLTLRRALGTDLGLRKSIADSQAARAGVWSAMAAYVPTINGTVARSYFKDTTLSGRQTSETMSLDASVTLLDMGTRYFGVKRAKA
ncbi:TolC family protein, partial [Zhengella mangrovi]|uniref:TolC family protein n=1 Tax=Zhengella mangrovi TaxID=1982044 RepID=UPI0010545732